MSPFYGSTIADQRLRGRVLECEVVMLHAQKSKRGEVFSDRLLVDYPYLLFARTLQVTMEAAK